MSSVRDRAGFTERWTCEQHRRLDLTVRDGPVLPEQSCHLVRGDELEAMPLVEPDRPRRRRPGADEHPAAAPPPEVLEEGPAHAVTLVLWQHVGVANEVGV